MTLTIIAPDGREMPFEFDDETTVLSAARIAAEHFALPGPAAWTLARDGRTIAAVLGLKSAGAQDGERLQLYRW